MKYKTKLAPGTIGAVAIVGDWWGVDPYNRPRVSRVAVYQQNPDYLTEVWSRPDAPRQKGQYGMVAGRCGCWRWVPLVILPWWVSIGPSK